MSSTSSRLVVEPTVTAFSLYFAGPRNGERMSERLDGLVTLVTGAASGIRKGTARRFCVVNNAGILRAVGSRAADLTAGYRRCLVGC
jgi:hypothetical protein